MEISFPLPSRKLTMSTFFFSVVFWSILVHRAHPVPKMKVGPVPGYLYLQSPINDNKMEVCVSDITFQNRNTIRK
ncbi:hypothetical protein BKA57DRAFT_450279 [Linnemannia elongata]|nr:hypothetical protein BKA57DRAFT_450279 [Linnemannia elongata]